MRLEEIITNRLIFLPLYHSSFKKYLPVDCIVAGLSSLSVVFFVTGLLV